MPALWFSGCRAGYALGSLKTGRRLARNVRAALFGRDKLHFAALDFQAADIAREQVAGYIAFGAA